MPLKLPNTGGEEGCLQGSCPQGKKVQTFIRCMFLLPVLVGSRLPIPQSMFQRKVHIAKVSHHGDSSTSANILLQRGSLSTPLKTRGTVSAWLTADHRPRSLSLHPSSVSLGLTVDRPWRKHIPFLLEWFGVGTRQSLNASDDLRHAVGKRFHLEDELAVCPGHYSSR